MNLNEPPASTPPPGDLLRNLPLGDLLALGTQFNDEMSPNTLLQDVADAICRTLGHPRVYVRLRNADTDVFEACAFAGLADETVTRLRSNPIAPTIYQRLLRPEQQLSTSFVIPAETLAERTVTVTTPPQDRRRMALLVPLRGRGDRLVGALYVEPAVDVRALDLSQVQVLEAIARQATLALENARLAARTQRLLAKEQLLAELGRDVGATLNLDTILQRTIARLAVLFQASSISLLNDDDELVISAAMGRIDEAARQVRLHIGEGIAGWVVQHGLPFLSNNVEREIRVQPAARHIGTNRGIRSYIAVPLRSGGRTIGVLSVESDRINAFTYEDVDLLEAVAAQIGGPINSARLYAAGQQLAEQVRRRNTHLEVINAIGQLAVSTVDIEQLLTIVPAQVRIGFDCRSVALFHHEEDHGRFDLVAYAGDGEPLALHNELQIEQLQRSGSILGDETLYIPIAASGRVLALLQLVPHSGAYFGAADVGALTTLADVLASAIEKARLYQRAQEAAVLEERSRLARDLHDSVSQQLFSMTLTAQAARAQIEKNPGRTALQLERLQETAQAALAEMRALIFQLRPPGLAEHGLLTTLQQHVAALNRREGLIIQLSISGDERHARGIDQAIYRIAQEALNNVVKHAGARQVDVTLTLQPKQVLLTVVDDGCGFVVEELPRSSGRHLGLTSMRERAAEAGGTLHVYSTPGNGTVIELVIKR
ncbi:MAG TPA: GAF domain-containing protein [Roseiflexaceae bacterium]|nr:GAF domain-containing protein [Roseiflexaceae bacterium]